MPDSIRLYVFIRYSDHCLSGPRLLIRCAIYLIYILNVLWSRINVIFNNCLRCCVLPWYYLTSLNQYPILSYLVKNIWAYNTREAQLVGLYHNIFLRHNLLLYSYDDTFVSTQTLTSLFCYNNEPEPLLEKNGNAITTLRYATYLGLCDISAELVIISARQGISRTKSLKRHNFHCSCLTRHW